MTRPEVSAQASTDAVLAPFRTAFKTEHASMWQLADLLIRHQRPWPLASVTDAVLSQTLSLLIRNSKLESIVGFFALK
jgi:hypothetical protein